MAGVEVSRAKLDALASKLDALELDDDERAVLHAVFAAATPESEVAGYVHDISFGWHKPISEGFLNVFSPAGKVGFGLDGDPGGGGVHITPT